MHKWLYEKELDLKSCVLMNRQDRIEDYKLSLKEFKERVLDGSQLSGEEAKKYGFDVIIVLYESCGPYRES
jgi:hypothetical protein